MGNDSMSGRGTPTVIDSRTNQNINVVSSPNSPLSGSGNNGATTAGPTPQWGSSTVAPMDQPSSAGGQLNQTHYGSQAGMGPSSGRLDDQTLSPSRNTVPPPPPFSTGDGLGGQHLSGAGDPGGQHLSGPGNLQPTSADELSPPPPSPTPRALNTDPQ
jgi:hypothetical protein